MKETIIEYEKAALTVYYKFDNQTRRLTSQELKVYAALILKDKEELNNGGHIYIFHQTKVGQMIKGRF